MEVKARYEGGTRHGEADFRADEDQGKVERGTDGGYRPRMQAVADGDRSMLTPGPHTTHLARAHHEVAAILHAIRRLPQATV